MSLWDMLKPDLQDYIISIRDAEKDRDIPKLGYYKFSLNNNIEYYFHIVKLNVKTFRAGYIMLNFNDTIKSKEGGVITEYQWPFYLKTSLRDKSNKPYFKFFGTINIHIRDLIPIHSIDFLGARIEFLRHFHSRLRWVSDNSDDEYEE